LFPEIPWNLASTVRLPALEDRLSLAGKKKEEENRLAYLGHPVATMQRAFDNANEPLKEFPSLDFQPNSEDPLQDLNREERSGI